MKSRQAGDTLAITVILLVVVLIGALGFVLYNNFSAQKSDSASKVGDNTSNQTGSDATDPQLIGRGSTKDGKSLVITQWGVRLPLTPVISDATYFINSYNVTTESGKSLGQQQVLFLSTKKIDKACEAKKDYECSIAGIDRGKADETFIVQSGVEGKFKDYGTKVGDYYYHFSLGNGQQTDEVDYEEALRKAFPEAFAKLSVE